MNEFIQLWQPTSSLVREFLPEIVLAAFALLVLALDVWFPKSRRDAGGAATLCGLLLAGVVLVAQTMCPGDCYGECLKESRNIFGFSPLSILTGPFFLVCAFFTVLIGKVVRERTEFSAPITNHLILVATAAAMALTKASNFVAFFVLLETLTVSLYALVGSYRTSVASLEAGVKYLIAGGVSGGLMLFGIVLLYGTTALAGVGSGAGMDWLGYEAVARMLSADATNPVALVGAAMVLAGVMFKFGIFPMQFWIPDTYQGAPLHVTFFLATVSKAVGFFMTIVLLSLVFAPIIGSLLPILIVLTLISMVYANLAALGQRKVKRLLGLSGVSHASYMMLGILAFAKLFSEEAFAEASASAIVMACALLLYMAFYVLSQYPIFAVMARVPSRSGDDAMQDFGDFQGLAKRSPVLAGAVASGLASLAGIPPTVGFITKLGILWIVFSAGLYVPAAIMLACVVASVYYYFSWIRSVFATDDGEVPEDAPALLLPGIAARTSLVFFTALTVFGSLVYFAVIASV